MSSGNEAQVISVAKVQHTDLGLANARGIRENGIKDRLKLARRRADDFQYFGGRGLALGRLTEFAGELVKLVPQACRGRVLDRRFAGLGPIRARNFHRPSAPTAMHWLRRGWYQLSRVPRKGLAPGLQGCPLGQKQTYAAHNGMSALLSIATAKADSCTKPCLLCPRKRTCAVQ